MRWYNDLVRMRVFPDAKDILKVTALYKLPLGMVAFVIQLAPHWIP